MCDQVDHLLCVCTLLWTSISRYRVIRYVPRQLELQHKMTMSAQLQTHAAVALPAMKPASL